MDCNIAFKTAKIKLSMSRVHKTQTIVTNVHNKDIEILKCAQCVKTLFKCAQCDQILHIYINF